MHEPDSPSSDSSGQGPGQGFPHRHNKVFFLVVGAMGVVFGDIGTSPLYAVKECFFGIHTIPTSRSNVFGVISLVLWSLVVVVCLKYVLFMLRADNRGEGGIFALLALSRSVNQTKSSKAYSFVAMAAILGAALIYGDGVITPAISVLSAMEGLEVATKAMSPIVVPLTCFVLLSLFMVQRWGTQRVGKVF
jgi:KUP system potassium uptake protein